MNGGRDSGATAPGVRGPSKRLEAMSRMLAFFDPKELNYRTGDRTTLMGHDLTLQRRDRHSDRWVALDHGSGEEITVHCSVLPAHRPTGILRGTVRAHETPRASVANPSSGPEIPVNKNRKESK